MVPVCGRPENWVGECRVVRAKASIKRGFDRRDGVVNEFTPTPHKVLPTRRNKRVCRRVARLAGGAKREGVRTCG